MPRPHVATLQGLSALRDLEVLTRATVEGLRQGLHRSPFHGFSAEFRQYRRYRPGDDLKYVDWKAFARTDRLYTRQFRESTNLQALFVLDVSRSMDFAAKFQLAQVVTAVLGTLVLDQGDAAGVLAVDDRAHLLPPRSGLHHRRIFLAQVAALKPVGAVGVHEALRRVATVLKRRGVIVVISDFYEEPDALLEVRRLSRMGHDVVVIHTVSKDELGLGMEGAAEFVDLESGRTLVVQPEAVRRGYVAAVDRWLADVAGQVTREGLDYLRLVAGEPIEAPLRRFLVSRRGQH